MKKKSKKPYVLNKDEAIAKSDPMASFHAKEEDKILNETISTEDTQCECCNGKSIEEVKAEREKYLKEFGWYADFVHEDESYPYGINYHTHGVFENFNHLDFQVIFPVPPKITHNIFNSIILKIQSEKKTYGPEQDYSGIIGNDLQIRFIKVKEGGRDLLRIIFPDKNGTLSIDQMDSRFQQQYLKLR